MDESTADNADGLGATLPLPPGLRVQTPRPWLWDDDPNNPSVPPLSDPGTYDLRPLVNGDAALLHSAPFDVLDGEPGAPTSAENRRAYCRVSADVTMRGGTTSGVIYPLAICELARRFRLRNVGGTSAGAIAAAAAAAAETGRAAADRGHPPAGGQRETGQGFAGLVDVVRWLAGLDTPDTLGTPDGSGARDASVARDASGTRPRRGAAQEQYRLAQLFCPTQRARPLYRLIVALMRSRLWALPVLAIGAFGWFSKILVLGVLAAGVYAVGEVAGVNYLRAAAGLVAVAMAVAGGFALAWPGRRPAPDTAELVPVDRGGSTAVRRAMGLLLLLAAAGILLAVGLWQPRSLATLAIVWFVGAALIAIVLGSSVWRLLGRAKRSGFGLIAGASKPPRRRNPWDVIAGLPRQTVAQPLIPWLSDTLNDLAGVDRSVLLRFGHLWYGADFQPGETPADAPADAEQRLDDPRRRMVNLELMTTELVRGVPYRFPLARWQQGPRGEPLLFVRAEDLRELFPQEVVDTLTAGEPTTATVVSTREPTTGLYALPEPWNLPVIFAVRLSLALPGLFTAVRLYQRVDPAIARDDLGRRIIDAQGHAHCYPTAGSDRWVEELWFSDGGISSNFPIHFFDASLPLWPTFGINLGAHPPGSAHQDVSLPDDWDSSVAPAKALHSGFLGFLNAIVNTARSWRDTTQTLMPGLRGRVASVRQREDEGGSNLFMPRETIASLALRGIVAGARLRRRFGNRAYWERHQWLRLRITAANLEETRRSLARTLGDDVFDRLRGSDGTQDGLLRELATAIRVAGGDADEPPGDGWYNPTPPTADFWSGVQRVLAAAGTLPANPSLLDRNPQPAPHLRQVPPL